MASDDCGRFESEAASFVLGDVAAPLRSQMLTHLDSCGPCRREAVMLAAALDSISATVAPVAPSAGFAERVVAAAEPATFPFPLGAADPSIPPKTPSIVQRLAARRARRDQPMTATMPEAVAPAARPEPVPVVLRPVTLVARRRRTLTALAGMTAVLLAVGLGLHTWLVLGLAICSALLAGTYLALVISVTHTKARQDLFSAFRSEDGADDSYWRELEPELLSPTEAPDELAVPGVVAVDNTALVRFVLAYFAGWALTPLVVLIRLMRGDLTGLEQSRLLGHIVDLQRRGRAQSLRLLVAGATTVAVAGGGTAATMLIAPSVAWAAPAPQTYTAHAGDTLSAIAQRYGVSTSYLAQLNGISNPNLIFAGQVIKVGGATAASSSGTYTVRDGDTLDSIAARFGTTVSQLASLNKISDPSLIFAGQTLRLNGSGTAPAATVTLAVSTSHTYTVRAGDTLGSIAARFGTTVSQLASLNKISDPSLIFAGQVLTLSGTAAPATAPRSDPAPAPAPKTVDPAPAASGYVNPFTHGSWSPARIDQGVDWIPNAVSPVVAIGNGVVTYSSMSSGWPGGGFISYRLTSGSHAGYYVYVAEHITNLLPVGTTVSAGQQIATALPGDPWTEWGWALGYAPAPAPGSQYNGAPDGTATPGGKAFARFLMSLGVTGIENPGSGPTIP